LSKPFAWMLAAILACAAQPGAAASDFAPPSLRGGQFVLSKPWAMAPATALPTLAGDEARLEDLRGQVVLLNFWATWCLPCVHEMPALDRLAATALPGLAVVAVSIDEGGRAAVAPFIAQRGLVHLTVYLDPRQRLGSLFASKQDAKAMPLWSLPMTYLIDRRGRVVGYLSGAAEWDSPQARAFLRYFLEWPS
jgi:thiol-disulfide isomerase/thioredoxin